MHIKSTSILSSVTRWLLRWIEIANALIARGCSSKTDSKCTNGIDVSFRRILTRRTHYRHQKEKFRNFFCVVPFYEFESIHGLIFSEKGALLNKIIFLFSLWNIYYFIFRKSADIPKGVKIDRNGCKKMTENRNLT